MQVAAVQVAAAARRLELRPGLALLALAAATPLLVGFSATAAFETSADLGGGGGMSFTGSPVSHGLTCATCHQGPAPTGGVGLASDPPGLFSKGFQRGALYRVTVRLSPERKGLDRNGKCTGHLGGCNRNAFVAEFLVDNGLPAGQLCTDTGVLSQSGCDNESGKETTLFSYARAVGGISMKDPELCGAGVTSNCLDLTGMSDEQAAAAIGAAVTARTNWTFQWRAPSASVPVQFWLGLVDGDGGTKVTTDHNDYFGDDTYLISRTLWPEGQEPPAAATGCGAARVPMPGLGLVGLWTGLGLWLWRRKADASCIRRASDRAKGSPTC